MPLISLQHLHTDPRNANVCSPEFLQKLQRHVERNGLCLSLLVRPDPERVGHYIIVDGHHRKRVAEALGLKEVECQIKVMSKDEAGLLLLTLNRLRGTDIPRKRAEWIESLRPTWSLESLAEILPESPAEMAGLLALLHQDESALTQALKAQLEAEQKSLPVPFGFMVSSEEAELIRQALSFYPAYRSPNEGTAWVAICRDVLTLWRAKDGYIQA